MSIEHIIVEIILVAFAGFIDAIGGGGGFITIPTFLLIGVPEALVLGTNKFTVTLGGTTAIYRFLRHNKIDLSLMKYGVITGLLGAISGAFLSRLLSAEAMVYLLLILIPCILIINTFKSRIFQLKSHHNLSDMQAINRCIIVSFVIGGYDGFFGPGTGTFLLLGFVFFLYMDYVDASINARLINFISNLSALAYFLIVNRIDWTPALIGVPASAFGYILGSQILIKGYNKIVKRVVNLVLIVLLGHLIFKYLIY
ncbi:sulfite exporter TauE/SafE family protein [Thiotrichales bacterium 19S3-7]|nr:sulfite exporter TauE/SafE family protein [Thiotrichales bacterium 19S3-7]MCF6802376.1 sulfite exporter TauE/SafE family protein [Thiotrichales bacterium 19S3-11]